jgi:hypothetical protein
MGVFFGRDDPPIRDLDLRFGRIDGKSPRVFFLELPQDRIIPSANARAIR